MSGGRFTDPALRSRLRAELPPELRNALRNDFEWYACRGAYFHTDAHYGDVLFGAFHVAGAPRDIVFARSGVRVAAVPGLWLIFDPFEPHAVLHPGELGYRRELYEAAALSYFVGFELDLSAPVRAVFGIGAAPPSGPRLASDIAVNAETGALSSVQAT